MNMQWLISLAAATWAVWTWAADNKREQERERARIAALYVNPFLSACEDLQSRIYSILELGGLCSLHNTKNVDNLPGRNRLARVQHHLVELINYIEKKEGYSLFSGERKQCFVLTPLASAEDKKSLPGKSG